MFRVNLVLVNDRNQGSTGLLQNAASVYPDCWAFLNTESHTGSSRVAPTSEGCQQCKVKEIYQIMKSVQLLPYVYKDFDTTNLSLTR